MSNREYETTKKEIKNIDKIRADFKIITKRDLRKLKIISKKIGLTDWKIFEVRFANVKRVKKK